MARPVLRPGMKHRSVREAKKLVVAHLKKFGKDEMATAVNPRRGRYGKGMEKGVRYVQRRFKLKVDGVIGPNTWKVLDYAKKPKPPVPVLTIVPRGRWAARAPRGVVRVKWTSRTPTRVHHTVTPKPKGRGRALRKAEREALREIQKYHMDSRKYDDIAYSFVIMPSGRVYEGRGKEVQGAHTVGHNEDCGIAFVGNYENDKLTRAQVLAYKNLRRKLGIRRGKAHAHSDTYATSCPGRHVKSRLGL